MGISHVKTFVHSVCLTGNLLMSKLLTSLFLCIENNMCFCFLKPQKSSPISYCGKCSVVSVFFALWIWKWLSQSMQIVLASRVLSAYEERLMKASDGGSWDSLCMVVVHIHSDLLPAFAHFHQCLNTFLGSKHWFSKNFGNIWFGAFWFQKYATVFGPPRILG